MNIGWFSSGKDKAARDLLRITQDYINRGEIKGKIIFSFCNRDPNETKESDKFLKLTRNLNIPSLYLSSKRFYEKSQSDNILQQRLQYDRQLMNILSTYNPDICVLAGYMLIVGEEMCSKYKMINLHPATPNGPKGSWQEVIWKLIKTRSEKSGVMVHLVTPELDRGPVITYCIYPINDKSFEKYWAKVQGNNLKQIQEEEGESNLLFRKIRKQGLAREFPLIIMTVKAICDGSINIISGKVFDRAGNAINGYDLSQEVNEVIGIA